MKAIPSMMFLALFSTALAGCWFYSRPDPVTPDCRRTTYGVAIASTSTENCPPSDTSQSPPPAIAPPIPPPSTP
jgi:hypothetical protein